MKKRQTPHRARLLGRSRVPSVWTVLLPPRVPCRKTTTRARALPARVPRRIAPRGTSTAKSVSGTTRFDSHSTRVSARLTSGSAVSSWSFVRSLFPSSNQQLKSIPPSIGDLSRFFNTPESSEQSLLSGRTMAHISTEPAIESARTRPFDRTQSIKDSGKERHVLKLYLMGNVITSLPPELFSVKNLTVLSLRM